MYRCILCGFDVELDDARVPIAGKCICIRCWTRETGDTHSLPTGLRKEAERAAKEAP